MPDTEKEHCPECHIPYHLGFTAGCKECSLRGWVIYPDGVPADKWVAQPRTVEGCINSIQLFPAPKIEDYGIVKSNSRVGLSDGVMEYINKGWELHGSAFCDSFNFYQPMVKYETST